MKFVPIAVAGIAIATAFPAFAQTSNSTLRSPSSSPYNGTSTGTSGSVGSSTSTYPAPLRDLNSPSVSGGTMARPVSPSTGGGVKR
jgi:hypothetical protein